MAPHTGRHSVSQAQVAPAPSAKRRGPQTDPPGSAGAGRSGGGEWLGPGHPGNENTGLVFSRTLGSKSTVNSGVSCHPSGAISVTAIVPRKVRENREAEGGLDIS